MISRKYARGSLQGPCSYWARKLKDDATRLSAYDKEALDIVEAVSRVRRMYLLGCKCFSMVTDHWTLVHLLKQSSNKLTDRKTDSLSGEVNALREVNA